MDAEQVGKVIDKIAEKAGVAVEAIQPLAEELVRQVQLRGMMQAIVGAAALVASVVIAASVISPRIKRLDEPGAPDSDIPIIAIGSAVVLFCGLFGIIGGLIGLEAYIAPIPTILGL